MYPSQLRRRPSEGAAILTACVSHPPIDAEKETPCNYFIFHFQYRTEDNAIDH